MTTTTYRACYAKETIQRGEILLTTEEDADRYDDAKLLELGLSYARQLGLEYTEADVEVGDWTEA